MKNQVSLHEVYVACRNTGITVLNEADRYDVVAAHYLWNQHHHGGQGSPEYARLSKISSYYKPGLSVRNGTLENEEQERIYDALCDKAGCDHERMGNSTRQDSEDPAPGWEPGTAGYNPSDPVND
ncbi:MAG: hypothetical protein WCJ49_06015 [Deltaproteobacteria bacterium]